MPSTRRQLLAATGLTLVGGVGAVAATEETIVGERSVAETESNTSALEWPVSQYDPAGTGYNPDASGPTEDVRVAWSHESTDWFRGAAPPIRLEDTIYAVGEGLLALEADTGERRFARRGPYTSSPARVSASAYRTDALAVTSTAGVFGLGAGGGIRIPGLGRWFGGQRWEGPGVGFHPSSPEHRPSVDPVAVDGTVYAPIYGTNDLVALEANDGTERWRITHHEDDPVGVSYGRPAVRDDTLYVANWPHQVTAYDRDDGSMRWQRERDDQMQLCSVPTDEGVVVTSRNGIALLDLENGETIWHRDLDGNAVEGTAAVADGTIYASDGRETFYALALETGEELWSAPFERETEPVVADGMVYAVEEDRALIGFDAETGDERFRYEPSQVPLSPPIVGDGMLYAVNRRRVIALEEA
ncbi:PQQ-binding-like beta-propeller repeat protein [Natrarchaeobius sp. A-rgal3]|uniref:PQQ-binding-like beta-propeller repeat protein n=1 Tax=Natrarchaeobius versutus TaxID=1679078 RepID=UPI00350F4958